MAAGALPLRAGTEPHFFLFPGRIERHEIHRVGIRRLQQFLDDIAPRRFYGDCDQRIEHRLVVQLPAAKPFGERRKDMRGLSEQFARFRKRPVDRNSSSSGT